MKLSNYTNYEGSRDVIERLRDNAIEASIEELRQRDNLTVALRSALRNGMSIDDLSEASGLTPSEIRRRVEMDLALGEDMDTLAGTR